MPVVRLHDARHGYGSSLAENGVPIPLISQVMGHAGPEITARIYLYARKEGAYDVVRAASAAAGL